MAIGMAELIFLSAALIAVVLILILVKIFLLPGSNKIKALVDSFNDTALVKYTPTSKFEEVVSGILAFYLNTGANVLLVTAAPRAGSYSKKLQNHFNKGDLRSTFPRSLKGCQKEA